jgi:hypothetical protein
VCRRGGERCDAGRRGGNQRRGTTGVHSRNRADPTREDGLRLLSPRRCAIVCVGPLVRAVVRGGVSSSSRGAEVYESGIGRSTSTDDPVPRPAAVAIPVQPALETPLGPSGASLPVHRRELQSIGWRDSECRVGDRDAHPCRSRRRARTRSAAFVKCPVPRLQSHCCPRRAAVGGFLA